MNHIFLAVSLIGTHVFTSLALWFWRGARGDAFAARCSLLLGGVGTAFAMACLASLTAHAPAKVWALFSVASGVAVCAALPLYSFVMLRRKRG